MEIDNIYNEDCLLGLRKMPDNFVDLTITSPPYGELRTYNGYSFDFENIAKELYRVTKDGGIVVWVCADSVVDGSESGTSFRQALYFKEIGFNIHDTMIYLKSGSSCPDPTRYFQDFEYIFVFSKGKPKTFNPIMREKKASSIEKKLHRGTIRLADGTLKTVYRDTRNIYCVHSNVWHYDAGKHKSTKDYYASAHPAIFPEKLAEDNVLSWSNEGDLVLDPFMGSGTTGKMAILNHRHYIGFEISSEYCKIIDRRIKEAKETVKSADNLKEFFI
jgi:DNA modification methylase